LFLIAVARTSIPATIAEENYCGKLKALHA
jgi:hypothetical protein